MGVDRCMLGEMVVRSPIMVAAVLGALMPGLARGEDAQGSALPIVMAVTRLGKAGQHAQAAELAAAGAAREDLNNAERVALAGLAARSFELSYEAGGALTDLCGLAAVMRLAAPLDTAEGGAVKRAATCVTRPPAPANSPAARAMNAMVSMPCATMPPSPASTA